jgi:hypothetical protein
MVGKYPELQSREAIPDIHAYPTLNVLLSEFGRLLAIVLQGPILSDFERSQGSSKDALGCSHSSGGH